MNSKVKRTITRVIFGTRNVVDAETSFFYRANERIDTCMSYTRPSVALSLQPIKTAFLDAKRRGVKLRYITEITHHNFEYCKELLALIHELRHLDGIKSNFMISEEEYLAPLVQDRREVIASELIHSNVNQVVEHGQHIFDTLWSKAIPAEERLKELQDGNIPLETKILDNQDEIIKQIIHLSEASSGLSVVSNYGGMQLTYNNFSSCVRKY